MALESSVLKRRNKSSSPQRKIMLPLELVELIIYHLDNPESVYFCSLVCKTWQDYICENDKRLFQSKCRYSEREVQNLDHIKLIESLKATSVNLSKLGPFFSRWYTTFIIDRNLAAGNPIRIPHLNAPLYLDKIPDSFNHIIFGGHGLEVNYTADPVDTFPIGDAPFGIPAFRAHLNLSDNTLHYNRENPGYNLSPKYQSEYPVLELDGKLIHFSALYASFGDRLSVYSYLKSDGVGYVGIFNPDFSPVQIWTCALNYYSKIWFVLDGSAILIRTVGSSMYLCPAKASGHLVLDISQEIHLGEETDFVGNDYFATNHRVVRFNISDWTLHSAPITEILAKRDLNLVTWTAVGNCSLFRLDEEWRQCVFWDFDGRYFFFRLSRPLPSYNHFAVVDMLNLEVRVYATKSRLGSQMIMDVHGRVVALTMETADRLIAHAAHFGQENYPVDLSCLKPVCN